MLEAVCLLCRHIFVPADEDDTEHGQCEDCGKVCGGTGVIIAELFPTVPPHTKGERK